MIKQLMKIALKSVDKEKNTLKAVFSTMDEDRHGDVVLQNWELDKFIQNPVIINSHNYGDATEVVGKALSVGIVDNKLEGEIEFAVDANPKAKVIFDMFAGGFLNAFSVGFIPKAFDEKNRIVLSELLEVSVVSVPANAMALAKSNGIDTSPLEDPEIKSMKSQISELSETVQRLCEKAKKVETRRISDDGAEVKRKVNRTIRLLTTLKDRI